MCSDKMLSTFSFHSPHLFAYITMKWCPKYAKPDTILCVALNKYPVQAVSPSPPWKKTVNGSPPFLPFQPRRHFPMLTSMRFANIHIHVIDMHDFIRYLLAPWLAMRRGDAKEGQCDMTPASWEPKMRTCGQTSYENQQEEDQVEIEKCKTVTADGS